MNVARVKVPGQEWTPWDLVPTTEMGVWRAWGPRTPVTSIFFLLVKHPPVQLSRFISAPSKTADKMGFDEVGWAPPFHPPPPGREAAD